MVLDINVIIQLLFNKKINHRIRISVTETLLLLSLMLCASVDLKALNCVGGAAADVLLWRNKKISAGVLGGATAAWVLFELIEYHLLTLVCHVLILALAILFLWSIAHTFINK